MENLVLQALGNSEVEKINKIKKNKEFLRRLIGDLQQVYTFYVSNVLDSSPNTLVSSTYLSNSSNNNEIVQGLFELKFLCYRTILVGINVLFQDVDLVWFRDPFSYFKVCRNLSVSKLWMYL